MTRNSSPTSRAEYTRAYRQRRKEEGRPWGGDRAEYFRAYRQRRKEEGHAPKQWTGPGRLAWERERRAKAKASLPFLGCDGEGAGVDDQGRQQYRLLRIGDRELYTGRPLTTLECLDFICASPAKAILVGFAFGYDVTMILKDLPGERLSRLFAPKVFEKGHSNFTWWKEFEIEYLPRQYLRVRKSEEILNPDGSMTHRVVKGSTRTIWETFGFFQKSFLASIESFNVPTAHEAQIIKRMKAKRSDFSKITPEIRAYCALECQLLARLMGLLRDACHEAGIVPKTWSGAGKLAKALHMQHATPTRQEVIALVPERVRELAHEAYYGGRFEVTRIGRTKGTVHEYDICSAYPAALVDLPCLVHGRWEKLSKKKLKTHEGAFIADLSFTTPEHLNQPGRLNGFPIRTKSGAIQWPLEGSGVYWSDEIKSAEELGHVVKIKEVWAHHRDCDCRLFHWAEELFQYRKRIGKSGPGYPIKLGLNSLYGALAQRKGQGRYCNMVWAGLVTARTRARINRAVAAAPLGAVLMIATDGIYSTVRLPLDEGEDLGQWERQSFAGLTIVQPGLYWDTTKAKRKSRGLPGKFFEDPEKLAEFEAAWSGFVAAGDAKGQAPVITVPLQTFTGLKLAMSRGKPETAGKWIQDGRSITFDWRNKRIASHFEGESLSTSPVRGGARSLPHVNMDAVMNELQQLRDAFDDHPDFIDFSPPDF